MIRRTLALVALLALAACAGGEQRYHGPQLKPIAQPGDVVATELAFADAARQEGQWTAFAEYAADGALIFGRNGAFEARPWLKQQTNPPTAVGWEPHGVWSSCDGSLALSQGGYWQADGEVGQFYTVWQRQPDGAYKWLFDFGYPTATAPAAPELIQAQVAQCDVPAATLAAAAIDHASSDAPMHYSTDHTLAWDFAFTGSGTRSFNVWAAGKGGYDKIVGVSIPPQP